MFCMVKVIYSDGLCMSCSEHVGPQASWIIKIGQNCVSGSLTQSN